MTRRYFAPNLRESQNIQLPEEEVHHASVMRVKVGDSLVVFDGAGYEAPGEVLAINRKQVLVALQGPCEYVDRERVPSIHLGVAFPKGDRQKFLIEKAVELGASSLTPIISRRSVVRPEPDAVLKMRRAVVEASKQCGRNVLMEVHPATDVMTFVEATPPTANRWVADPSGLPLKQTYPEEAACNSEAFFLIGPEGGFTEEELAAATAAGWQLLNLGSRILRVETAALAILASFGGGWSE